MSGKISRRAFVRTTASTGAVLVFSHAFPLGLSAEALEPLPEQLPPRLGPTFFSEEERKVLAKTCDYFFRGASSLGAVRFIEELLTAFDSNPPRIFLAAPFSGRRPQGDQILPGEPKLPVTPELEFIPLSREQDYAWRLRIFGSAGVPDGGPNGHVVGLRDLFRYGVNQSKKLSTIPFENLDPEEAGQIVKKLKKEYHETVMQLTLQACFSMPEYGGNLNGQGWARIGYPGDSAPIGWSTYNPATGEYEERADYPVTKQDPKFRLDKATGKKVKSDPHGWTWALELVLSVMSLFRVNGARKFK